MAGSSKWSGRSPFKAKMSGSSPASAAVDVAEMDMHRIVVPGEEILNAGSSPVVHRKGEILAKP